MGAHFRRAGAVASAVAVLALCSPARTQAVSYAYDVLGRVISVTYPNGQVTSYTYDAAGNRARVQSGGSTPPPPPPPANRPPAALPDTWGSTVRPNVELEVYPLGNDSDPDGDPLIVVAVSDVTCGHVLEDIYPDHVVFHAPDYPAQCTFTYYISDGRGAISNSTFTVTITNF